MVAMRCIGGQAIHKPHKSHPSAIPTWPESPHWQEAISMKNIPSQQVVATKFRTFAGLVVSLLFVVFVVPSSLSTRALKFWSGNDEKDANLS